MTATTRARPSSGSRRPATSLVRRVGVPAATAVRKVLADRGGLVATAVLYLLAAGVLSALWRAAAQREGGLVGYSADALTWYVFAAEAAVLSIDLRLIERVGADIASAAVEVEMLRPLPVVSVRLAVEAGQSLGRLAVLVGVGSAGAWWLAGPPPDPLRVPLVVVSLVLAVLANLTAQHVVAAAAFWLGDVRAAWFVWQKAVFLLGGMLLPLEVLPVALLRLALWCPFMTMAYAPARLAAGHGGVVLVGVQALWLAALVAAVADAVARPAAFWVQVAAMVLNDLVMIVFWVLFFHRVGTVRGWDVERVMLLFAVSRSRPASSWACCPTPAGSRSSWGPARSTRRCRCRCTRCATCW